MDTRTTHHIPGLEDMVTAYVECALWSSTDQADDTGGSPLDDSYGPEDIAPESMESMRADVVAFLGANRRDLADVDRAQAGHDFWLTRNRHGAGFWDRGLGELGARLTAEAHAYGESTVYVGDDGRLYVA